jgi:hypothetical protein
MPDSRRSIAVTFPRLTLLAILCFATTLAMAGDIRILQPTPEETVHDNSGNVTVEIMAKLDSGQRIRLLIDGSNAAPDSRDLTFNLNGINRGEHTLQALILNANGAAVSRSDKVVFYMWQASRQFPNRAK